MTNRDATCVEFLCFAVPLVPPSVNHYVKHTETGRHYITAEAQAFKDAVAIFAKGRHLDDKVKAVEVCITIYLGRGDKGDIDNYPKCVLDGLKGTVIRSDAMVKRMHVHLLRDPAEPRTKIEVLKMK